MWVQLVPEKGIEFNQNKNQISKSMPQKGSVKSLPWGKKITVKMFGFILCLFETRLLWELCTHLKANNDSGILWG